MRERKREREREREVGGGSEKVSTLVVHAQKSQTIITGLTLVRS